MKLKLSKSSPWNELDYEKITSHFAVLSAFNSYCEIMEKILSFIIPNHDCFIENKFTSTKPWLFSNLFLILSGQKNLYFFRSKMSQSVKQVQKKICQNSKNSKQNKTNSFTSSFEKTGNQRRLGISLEPHLLSTKIPTSSKNWMGFPHRDRKKENGKLNHTCDWYLRVGFEWRFAKGKCGKKQNFHQIINPRMERNQKNNETGWWFGEKVNKTEIGKPCVWKKLYKTLTNWNKTIFFINIRWKCFHISRAGTVVDVPTSCIVCFNHKKITQKTS